MLLKKYEEKLKEKLNHIREQKNKTDNEPKRPETPKREQVVKETPIKLYAEVDQAEKLHHKQDKINEANVDNHEKLANQQSSNGGYEDLMEEISNQERLQKERE